MLRSSVIGLPSHKSKELGIIAYNHILILRDPFFSFNI